MLGAELPEKLERGMSVCSVTLIGDKMRDNKFGNGVRRETKHMQYMWKETVKCDWRIIGDYA